MTPASVVELRNCAPADLARRRLAVYSDYEYLIDDQLGWHTENLRERRQRRPRRPKELNYCDNIASEVTDEISDFRQRLFLGLATAVERLRKMQTLPDDVEKYIAQEIRSQGTGYYRDDSLNIIPPPSTNTTRPDDAKYQPQKRKPNTIVMDDDVEVSTLELRSENAPYMPDCQRDQDDLFRGVDRNRDADHLKDELARTEEERAILARLEQGEPRRKIAVDLDVTEHRVRLTIDLFKHRCSS